MSSGMEMSIMQRVAATVVLGVGLAGCSAKQEITRLQTTPQYVCIVKHEAVREGVLETIESNFASRGIRTTVVAGIYEKKHSMWEPRFYLEQVKQCDALLFYVANWSWDLATYMSFANIWMTSADGSRRTAQATYDASQVLGANKYIKASPKIQDLMNQLLGSAGPGHLVTPIASTPPDSAPAESLESNVSSRLRELDELKRQGLVSEEEYKAKKVEILKSL